jgi:hypothetical protein
VSLSLVFLPFITDSGLSDFFAATSELGFPEISSPTNGGGTQFHQSCREKKKKRSQLAMAKLQLTGQIL